MVIAKKIFFNEIFKLDVMLVNRSTKKIKILVFVGHVINHLICLAFEVKSYFEIF